MTPKGLKLQLLKRLEGVGGVNEMEKRDLVSESDGKCREIWLRNLNITAAC